MFQDTTTQEEVNRARVQGWFDLAGIEPDYPLDTGTACRILQTVEYAVSPDDALAYVQQGIVPPVAGENGRLEWTATSLVTLAAALEARRRWHPFSQLHGHKLTMVEKVQQICEHRGESAFQDLGKFDMEGLLGMLVSVSHDKGAVETLAAAIRFKLSNEGVL